MLYLAKLLSYSALAVAVLASEDAQTPLQSPLPRHRYVDCTNKAWDGRILECGQLEVPLDWSNPALGSLTLNYTTLPVKRRTPRKGAVFLHLGHEYLGRLSHPEHGLNMLFSEGRQLEDIVPEYDLVMWTSRDIAISQRTPCFAYSDEDRFRITRNPYARRENATVAFYNATFREDFLREPPWNEEMTWADTQKPEDVTDMLRAEEKMVVQCLDASPDRDLFRYGGTAASIRDLVALADAIDGHDSPVNLWTKHHGSVLASHLLKMFPKRVGRVVMDDPVDPVEYQEVPSHEQWSLDIATANNTLALIQQNDMKNGSTGFMEFFGRPSVDEVRFGQIVQFLHSELVQWHTRAETDYQYVIATKEREWWSNPHDWDSELNFKMFTGSTRQSTGVNGWRLGRSAWTAQALDGMPLVCGDALYDRDTDLAMMRAQVERSIIDSMHAAPLIAMSAFPTLRYLCHIWPIRAVERVSLRGVNELALHDKVLVLLRDKDYWNYFSVSETTAHGRWPAASVVGGLRYGDLTLDHHQCSFNIIKAFYDTGTVPEGSRPCLYDEEEM